MQKISGLLLIVTFLAAPILAARPMPGLPPIWRNDEAPGDLGKVYYQTNEFCKAVRLDSLPLRVSEFSTGKSDKDADFENLRATDFFDSTGANIQSLIPQGSLVLLPEDGGKEYRKVDVVSQAFFYVSDLAAHNKENNANRPVVKLKESGYLHRDSLEDMSHYFLRLRSDRYIEAARAHGLDLDDATLYISKTKEKINALNCCVGGKCESFVIFNIVRPDEKLGAHQIAISPRIADLLSTATAQPLDDDDDGDYDHAPEISVNRTRKSGPQFRQAIPVYIPLSSSVDGATAKPEPSGMGSIAGVPITGETSDKVICTASGKVSVRGLNAAGEIQENSAFKVKSGEAVLVRQGFDGARKTYKSGRETHVMVEVEIPRVSKRGWVAEQFILSQSACSDAQKKAEPVPDSSPEISSEAAALISGGVFPTTQRPSYSYTPGNANRWFGADRACPRRTKSKKSGSCGRLHAACDLFRKQGEPARAILDGEVIQSPYDFYQGTWAVEIKHSNGKIVRYGEISGKRAPGITAGATVKQGQVVGYIKKVNSSCCDPMLHFEMYAGTGRGALTQRGRGGFQRRSDLEDPTAALKKLETSTFGKSW